MLSLVTLLERLPGFRTLRDGAEPGSRQRAVGLAGSARSVLAASLFYRTRRTVLVVTAGTRQAENYVDDLHALVRTDTDDLAPPLRLFPSLPTLLYDEIGVDRQLVGQRLEVMEALLRGEPQVVVAPLSAILHRTVPPAEMAGSELCLQVGDRLDPAGLIEHLEQLGYRRHEPVLVPGECSLRGGIVDVYPMTAPQPLRIELWGDEIESIRLFDVNSQRSTLPQQRFVITVSRETVRNRAVDAAVMANISSACEQQAGRLEKAGRGIEAKRLRARVADDLHHLERGETFDGGEHYLPYLYDDVCTIIDYLPPDAIVVIDEPALLLARARELSHEIDELYRARLAGGALLALPSPLYVYHSTARPLWQNLASIELLAEEDPAEPVSAVFDIQPMPAFDGDLAAATEALQAWRAEGYRLYCTTHQVGRLEQILASHGIDDFKPMALDRMPPPGDLWIVDQRLSGGFLAPEVQVAVVTDHEVFGWRRARARRGRGVAARGSTALASLTELAPGEFVVHTFHGVGVYAGLVAREVAGVERDYLQIDYAGSDRLYVPVTELDRLQRYLGPEGHDPAVNGLGDNRWRKATARARQKAQAVARDLVELYARRMAEPGHPFAADTPRQHQVEAAFIYEETPDQLEAVQATKQDMERTRPMDRLLCGDVGFGKTEVAVRAAMKAVADRWQVAVLVPTTVLAQQHFGTFNERLEAFGVRVDVLSRFRSRREQVDILDRLRNGEIDVVIGTHRLLSEDIHFHRLGLLVIDEEQRFGVRHKERIKELRVGVDVLTMTATPLPRTLNQAMVGISELSLLQDPPAGRLPVLTTVAERRDDIVREALLREVERDGQVYFLHNRVRSIERAANHVQRLVPTARVGIAHGQMHEDDLEEVMLEMYAGRYDVLVCTSIIENGLDISNVNTIVVDDCDQFGLAQLYQLIGRVGRRERQAYAYLLHRPHKTLTDEAQQRIEALLELTELGAGFQIALRDLEIRGAGSLLGTQQSGFIEEVGYELYTQMVAEALRVFRGEAPAEEDIPLLAEIELPVKAGLPRSYVGDERQRIDLYRRLSGARTDAVVKELEQEVRDRYGRVPEQAANLFRVAHLRLAADRAGVATLKAVGRFLAADFARQQALDGKEMRALAKALARAAMRGGAPGLKLTPEGLTADLHIPRVWDVLEAAEAMVGVLESARRDVVVAVRR